MRQWDGPPSWLYRHTGPKAEHRIPHRKQFTADLALLIDQVAGYVVVTAEDLLSASPRLRSEDRIAQGGCILGRQLVMLDLIDLIVCGGISTHRTEGFQVEVMILSMGESQWEEFGMASIQTHSLDLAVQQVATEFEEMGGGLDHEGAVQTRQAGILCRRPMIKRAPRHPPMLELIELEGTER